MAVKMKPLPPKVGSVFGTKQATVAAISFLLGKLNERLYTIILTKTNMHRVYCLEIEGPCTRPPLNDNYTYWDCCWDRQTNSFWTYIYFEYGIQQNRKADIEKRFSAISEALSC